MKTLFAQILDPSGHRRILKWTQLPVVLGTDLSQKHQLRDPKLSSEAVIIERHEERGLVFMVLQPQLTAKVGDLKLQAFDLPFFVPIKMGDTEIIFTETEVRAPVVECPSGERAWYTESEAGQSMLQSVKKSALTRLSIYLNGETGTGKEVLAKLVHAWSDRASRPFVPLNCGALALSLAESELFGHIKGSFTGAIRDRPGALLQAHGGTLFLDEVGDLPPELQVKLLRFLESGEIRPVGSDRVLHADVRIVCATHKHLKTLVEQGKFRQDLYFRLASIPIEIPSLRSRPEDIRALAIQFSKEFDKTLSGDALTKLQVNAWPGNVRELRHAVERACGLVGPFQSLVNAADFDFLHESATAASNLDMHLPGVSSLKEMEKWMILRALRLANGNRTDAAKILGIARSTLFEMMKRHAIMGPKSTDYWMAHFMAESS
jgi:hypothetical protein